MRSNLLLAALVALVAVLAACESAPASPSGSPGPGATVPDGTASPPAGTGATPSGGIESPSPSQPGASGDVVIGSGDFFMPDPAVGLADLSAYRSTLTVTFDGTADGRPRRWSTTRRFAASGDPRAVAFTIEGTGDLDPVDPGDLPDSTWQAILDGAAYQLGPDGSCAAKVAGPDTPAPPEPVARLSAVIGAVEAGRETIDGVGTEAFTFDERALGITSDAKSTGKLWLATAGGVLVRYEVTTVGGPGYFGEGVSGSLAMRYELTDVNGSVAIDLPKDCPPGLIAAVRPADATNVDSAPGLLTYTTRASVGNAAKHVRQSAAANGWAVDEAAVIRTDSAHLTFNEGAIHYDVFVSAVGGETEVVISAGWG